MRTKLCLPLMNDQMADLMLCSVIRGGWPTGLDTVVDDSEYIDIKSLASLEETLSFACSQYEGSCVEDIVRLIMVQFEG